MWRASQKTQDTSADPDTTTIDAPETPAAVFAVRAFKHAIFGTPQTVQPRPPRRHSNTENATRQRQNARPRIDRPKSTNDAQTLGKLEGAIEDEPLPSPTKGILLTPGTAAGRRKTVSFGDHVLDNEGKRPVKSGLPDDCPGKFPSPWAKSAVEHESSDEPTEKPRSRSKLTEALEQAREESSKRKVRTSKNVKSENDTDVTLNFGEPQSDSGKYWKQEYDIYRERTTREVRKLVRRQKETKDYARQVDSENTDLREELRRERKRVERLERRTVELEAQMKDFQEKLQRDGLPTAMGARQEEETQPRSSAGGHEVEQPNISSVEEPSARERPLRPQRRSWRTTTNQAEVDQKPFQIQETFKMASVEAADGAQRASEKHRSALRVARTKSQEDSWAQSFVSSTKDLPEADPGPPSPLKSLNVNILAQDTRNVAMSMGLQPPSPVRDKRRDSPIRAPDSGLPSPEFSSRTAQVRLSQTTKDDDWSIQHPQSSPFQPDAVAERPNILTGAPVPVSPTSRRPDLKENMLPAARSQSQNQENDKPSAAWNAMSAASEPRRVVSKDTGKALDNDRLERARARLAAKGRTVS